MEKTRTKQLSLMQKLFPVTIKKTMVVIVLFSMLLNGFVPASQQSKENLFLAATVAVSNSIFTALNQYQNRLTEISNSLAKDLCKFLLLKETRTDVPYNNKDQKDPIPVNTSSDVAIILDQDNTFKIIKYINSNIQLFLTEGKIQKDLYILYQQIKDCCSNNNVMEIMLFILFIITIRNRKEDIIEITSNRKIMKHRTNLC